MRYAIVIEKAENNYAAYVPDLLGCVATGKTIEETEQPGRIRRSCGVKLRRLSKQEVQEKINADTNAPAIFPAESTVAAGRGPGQEDQNRAVRMSRPAPARDRRLHRRLVLLNPLVVLQLKVSSS